MNRRHTLQTLALPSCRFFAALPTLTLGFLYLFAWHCTHLIGRWPRAYLDDPKGIYHDFTYRFLDAIICETHSQFGLIALTLWSPLLFTGLLALCWRRLNPWHRTGLIALYVCGMTLLLADPGRRLDWYLD